MTDNSIVDIWGVGDRTGQGVRTGAGAGRKDSRPAAVAMMTNDAAF